MFTGTVNNTAGLFSGETSGLGFLFYVLPLGFLLTQYTITGYDASAHLSEETQGAASGAARGLWQSIFYSAIGGYVLLLSFVYAVQDKDAVTAAGGGVQVIFDQALGAKWASVVLLIASIGQLFCATAGMTSCTRMLFAFSRDGAVPGSRLWSNLNANRVPVNAVFLTAAVSAILTAPALIEFNIGTDKEPIIVGLAFSAVVSIGVIGLYLAFAIPIFLRWKLGDEFQQGSWNLGNHWKWMAPLAVAEIAITTVYFVLPTSKLGVPFSSDFDWKLVNYTGVVTFGALLALWIYWHLSVKHWFKGPKHTIDPTVVGVFDD